MTQLRVATYNIHKGVRGVGPRKRLEIHNLGLAIQQFDADIVCLQEVRRVHARHAAHFPNWPQQPQADFLAPEGYWPVYRTNAFTRHGEHGNALLSRWPVASHRHEDMSDHRFEQRGLLHGEVHVDGVEIHVIVVHLGLIRAGRLRQLAQLRDYIARDVPPGAPLIVAGDFNDHGTLVSAELAALGLRGPQGLRLDTFPARLPLVQLDHVLARGLAVVGAQVPRGRAWWRMSDHLPLIVDFRIES